MKSVAQLLASKPGAIVHTVAPDASVAEAAELMARHNIGALLVLDGERIAGIVSERDLARKMLVIPRQPHTTPVSAIMQAKVRCVHVAHTNEDCMALMTEKRLRHLPVLDDGRLVGLISIGDLVKDIISEQQFLIEQLEHYISGDRGL
jgi:CBS domain-containing protein